MKETYKIVKESVDIIMMSKPAEIDLDEVKKLIEDIDKVKNIHHVHLWKMNDNDIHFEAHIDVDNISFADTSIIQRVIEKKLHDKFDISHSTLQFECSLCENMDLINNVI